MINDIIIMLIILNIVGLPASLITYFGIKNYGFCVEANKLAIKLMKKIGLEKATVCRHLYISAMAIYTTFLYNLIKVVGAAFTAGFIFYLLLNTMHDLVLWGLEKIEDDYYEIA